MSLLGLQVLACALACCAAGCPAGRDSGAAGSGAQPAAVKGGSVSLPLEISASDPAFKALDFSDGRLFALARCLEVPLVRSDPAGKPSPGLASQWRTADAGKTWVFTLRALPGHETDADYAGQLLAARFKQLLHGPDNPLRAQLCDLLAGAQDFAAQKAQEVAGIKLEGGELTLQLTRNDMLAPLWLSQPGLGVLPQSSAPSEGYGPFMLAAISADEVQLKRNAQALDGQPLLDELRFMLVPDRARQLELFQAGKLHAANVAVQTASSVADDPALAEAAVQHQTVAMLYGLFNLTHFPWNDSKFQSKQGLRQAMNYSVDRENLQAQLSEQVTGWTHFLPPAMDGFIDPGQLQQPLYPLVADADKAMAGQKESDHEQGAHLIPGMDLGFLEQGLLREAAKPILEDWEQVSVKMRPFPMHQAALELRLQNSSHEILLRMFRPGYAHPDALFYPLLYSKLPAAGGNWSGLNDAEVDRRITEAEATDDEVLRQVLYRELGADIEQRALCVLLGYYSPTLLASPDLAGYRLTPYDFDASLPAQDFAKLGVKAPPAVPES